MNDITKLKFSAQDYYFAALERKTEAYYLHESGRYALSMYISGLSIECILRAFKCIYDPTSIFDEKHDLIKLLKTSGLTEIGNEEFRFKIFKMVNRVFAVWRNNFRFFSDSKMRLYLKKIKRYRQIKGDFLKYNSKMLYEASSEIIKRGASKWQTLKRK